MKTNSLIITATEGPGGPSFSVNCPECGERVHFSITASWGGTEVDSKYCYNCQADIEIVGAVNNA